MRKRYPTDLSDADRNHIEPHMPAPKGFGRPGTHGLREILDAVFFVPKSGCQWRVLPHDSPRWPTVWWYFGKWCIDGTRERVDRAIRERLGVRLKREPRPSAGVVDSQSVKSTALDGEERGYDGAKKVKGILSAISWRTPRASCSRSRSIAQRRWTTRGSRRCCGGRTSGFPASLIRGWMRVTAQRTRGRTGH
jgi:transposase